MGDLEANLKAFNEQLPRLLETNEGRFAAAGEELEMILNAGILIMMQFNMLIKDMD